MGESGKIKNQTALAYTLHIIRSIIYGSSFLFTGYLLKQIEVFDLLALRFLICSVFFLILAATGLIQISFKGKHLKYIIATALFEPVGYFILETYGLKGITTSLAGILMAISPVITVILESLLLKEKTTSAQKLLGVLGISGVLLISVFSGSRTGQNTVWGILLIIAAHISGSLFCVSSRKTSEEYSCIEITFFTTITGAVVFNLISLFRHVGDGTVAGYFTPLFNIKNLVCFLFLGVLSSFAATIMNNYALSKIQASSLSILGGLTTVTSVILGVVFNAEQLYWYHILGVILIMLGAGGVNYITMKNKHKETSIAS